jgi:DNA polymerase III epsilon subunit-like protein
MIDPFILFKKWNKYNKGKKLTDAAVKYGVPYTGAHRAVNDATVTGKILFKMAATKPAFPNKLDKYVKLQRQWIEEQFIDFKNYRKSRGQELPTPPNYSYYEV